MPAKRHISKDQMSLLPDWEPETWAPSGRYWGELVDQHPDLDDHGTAVSAFMHGTDEDPMADQSGADPYDSYFRPLLVDTNDISHMRHPSSDSRVAHAMEGYQSSSPDVVPPVLLVKRGDTHEVVDGHHRVSAAKRVGMGKIRAWVAESPEQSSWTEPDW